MLSVVSWTSLIGHEVEGAQRADGALGLRIEGADRFERVAEEVEADRVGQARRERDR